MANSENIEFLDLDFSALTRANNYFLTNSIINYKDEFSINLSSLEESGLLFMYQRKNESNTPTVNLILGDTQWQNNWFVGDRYNSEYISAYYSSINLNIYTNYKGNIETAVQDFEDTTINYNVYDMPTE